MNKTELVAALAESAMTTKAEAARMLDSVLDTIQTTLARGENITVPGFGSFQVKKVEARSGKNPATGEPLLIAEHRRVLFKPGSQLKSAVN